jgi:hypothetical protein
MARRLGSCDALLGCSGGYTIGFGDHHGASSYCFALTSHLISISFLMFSEYMKKGGDRIKHAHSMVEGWSRLHGNPLCQN